MSRNRSQKQLADSATKLWPHSMHRECNEADKRTPVVAVEIVGNATLQFLRIGLVMNEDEIFPIREEEWLTMDRQQTMSGYFARAGNSEIRWRNTIPCRLDGVSPYQFVGREILDRARLCGATSRVHPFLQKADVRYTVAIAP